MLAEFACVEASGDTVIRVVFLHFLASNEFLQLKMSFYVLKPNPFRIKCKPRRMNSTTVYERMKGEINHT